jgi:hypothetical protein
MKTEVQCRELFRLSVRKTEALGKGNNSLIMKKTEVMCRELFGLSIRKTKSWVRE